MKTLRILLADDHALFRAGIASLIKTRPHMAVVGEATNGFDALEQAQSTHPDIILMDIHMPRCDGLEATHLIKQQLPGVEIVILTVSDEDNNLFAAIKAGAKGYLLKNLEPEQLFTMLEGISQGEAPISGAMASKILQEMRQPTQPDPNTSTPIDALTEREIDVLEEIVTGATNKEIAARLHVTENTVKIHLRNILEKLHVQNRVQAAVRAVRDGLLAEVPV